MKAIDAYWICAAEHGMNASTFTARVIASTGADVAAALSGAVGALSGPLHGGAPSRVLPMLDEVEQTGDAERWVKDALDRGDRLMGFGHRVYRAEDPRARVLRRTAREIGAPGSRSAEKLEKAALAELKARKPDRVLATNVEFWSAVVLDFAEVPPELFTPDVRERPRGRVGGAHHGAEAGGPADPAERPVHGPRAARRGLGERRRPRGLMADTACFEDQATSARSGDPGDDGGHRGLHRRQRGAPGHRRRPRRRAGGPAVDLQRLPASRSAR